MGGRVLKPFVLLMLGSSLSSNGRLAFDWPQKLVKELQQYPEAKGPIVIIDGAKGSQDSAGQLALIDPYAQLRPSHVLMETNSINDAIDGGSGPAVTITGHNTNVAATVAALRAARADTDITLMTMNGVSTLGATLRPNLAAYYTRDVALAGSLATGLLDNYNGTATVPGGWIKPLPEALTNRTVPFAMAPLAGYSDQGVSTALWSPTDKGSGITVSADGLTATVTGAGIGSVRGTTAITGKTHFEVTITNPNNPFPAIGVANAAMPVTGGLVAGDDANSFAWTTGQQVRGAGNTLASTAFAVATGTVIGVDVDATAKTIIFRQGAASSGPFDISGIAGAIYPVTTLAGSAASLGNFSQQPDGLHPLFTGGIDTYLYPSVIAWARAKMAAYWP